MSVPTDVFLFSVGEPLDRTATKVGGLPYRPASKPWPTGDDRRPFTFLAQFNFTESLDLVNELPGDILLVFVRERLLSWPGDLEQMQFEWYRLETEPQLCDYAPPPDWKFAIAYGERFRTIDYIDPAAAAVFIEVLETIDVNLPSRLEFADSLCRIEGMKIGGSPFWMPSIATNNIDLETAFPGTFLCSLSGIEPNWEVPYPWLNHPEPISFDEACLPEMKLLFGDGGSINFSIDDNQQIHWILQY